MEGRHITNGRERTEYSQKMHIIPSYNNKYFLRPFIKNIFSDLNKDKEEKVENQFKNNH